jgi:UDP-hydrolysing UDP-N-acetyl-D-glucosamine 2-epimerase
MMSANNKRTVAYVSGTRADFGLMTPVLKAINNHPALTLSLYATGMHLMPKYGETLNDASSIFPVVKRIEASFESSDAAGMAKFAADYFFMISREFVDTRPDLVLILGDRIEMLCTALAAFNLGIPVAHVHGGDKSSTNDDAYRHAITKVAHVHFPATALTAERIKKLGEDDWRINVVGAPTLDVILNEMLPSRAELFEHLGLDINARIILVTQHPESELADEAGQQMREILESVKFFGLPVVVTYPNADSGSQAMIEVIERERGNTLFKIYKSFPHKEFLALEREAAVWVGNSSGAMIESSSFHVPVVNVGLRQQGRLRGQNVIDVPHEREKIVTAIDKSLNDEAYRATLQHVQNPWGDGRTGPRVAKILAELKIDRFLLTKQITY